MYNPSARCSKCHFLHITTKTTTYLHSGVHVIERKCAQCQFVWHETPLDQPEELAVADLLIASYEYFRRLNGWGAI
jgi:hypothetical protein